MKNRFFSGAYSFFKKSLIAILGFFVLFIGILLIFLPGPAFVVIPIGLSILALEFEWPKRLLKKARKHGKDFLTFLKERK